MSSGLARVPKIMIPYPGLPAQPSQDIFVYLRPETNGILVESTLFKVIKRPEYSARIRLIYLANLPGDFIVKNRIVEHHYATKLHFAAHGKIAFTPSMIERFERFFGVSFQKAKILGAFEALTALHLNTEELFDLWVPVYDILETNGQLIKRGPDDVFIVNYDIPALLHKNNFSTDIAVMIFRTDYSYQEFQPILEEMKQALVQAGILDPHKPERRVFHYSKGPFEQILDGLGYLFASESELIPPAQMPFFDYLLQRNWDMEGILDLVRNPIRHFEKDGGLYEESLFTYTLFSSYPEAWKIANSIRKE